MNDIFTSDVILEIDPSKDYYTELVGEGKKYKDNQALGLSRVHADVTIVQRERELAQLREELETRISLEQFLDKMNTTNAGSQGPQNLDDSDTDKSAMSPQELENLVTAKIQQMDSQKTASQNLNVVNDKLAEVYGPNASQKLKSQAQELGMSVEELRTLGARNPKALYRLLGIDAQRQPEQFMSAPRSQSTSLPQGQKQGYSYYEKIRKEQPSQYFSPRIQNEMFSRVKEMGEDNFYST